MDTKEPMTETVERVLALVLEARDELRALEDASDRLCAAQRAWDEEMSRPASDPATMQRLLSNLRGAELNRDKAGQQVPDTLDMRAQVAGCYDTLQRMGAACRSITLYWANGFLARFGGA